jgi:hypothetical protein
VELPSLTGAPDVVEDRSAQFYGAHPTKMLLTLFECHDDLADASNGFANFEPNIVIDIFSCPRKLLKRKTEEQY